jgi:hypothetical protein
MGGNQINMAVGAEFTRGPTNCGMESVEINQIILVVIAQSGDDTRSVSAEGRKLDKPDS